MDGYIRIRHGDGTIERRYDPVVAEMLSRIRQLDRQTFADCIEADDPQKAEALRRNGA